MTTCVSKKKGFTLVEILIVLAVISMVILLGVSSYGVVRKKIQLDLAANSLASSIVEARDKTATLSSKSGSVANSISYVIAPTIDTHSKNGRPVS